MVKFSDDGYGKEASLARLGVVGGGQLARMLAPACNYHDVQMLILDSLNNSPAGQVAFDQIEGELMILLRCNSCVNDLMS